MRGLDSLLNFCCQNHELWSTYDTEDCRFGYSVVQYEWKLAFFDIFMIYQPCNNCDTSHDQLNHPPPLQARLIKEPPTLVALLTFGNLNAILDLVLPHLVRTANSYPWVSHRITINLWPVLVFTYFLVEKLYFASATDTNWSSDTEEISLFDSELRSQRNFVILSQVACRSRDGIIKSCWNSKPSTLSHAAISWPTGYLPKYDPT